MAGLAMGGRRLGLIAGTVAGLAVVVGVSWAWTWYGARDQVLSEKPPRSGAPAAPRATVSTLSATATITYAALADALTKALPETFSDEGTDHVCVDLQKTVVNGLDDDIGKIIGDAVNALPAGQAREVCEDVTYQVTVTRTDPVTVGRTDTALRISTAVAVTGHAGFSGEVAAALGLDSKNFRGAIRVFADLTASITPEWCPDLAGSASFKWTDKAELEIVKGVWLPIDGPVGDRIGAELDAAVKRVLAGVKCADVRDRVAAAWHPYAFPIALPDAIGGKVYLNLTPKDAGFSGLTYAGGILQVALAFRATTEVATAAIPETTKLKLPPLRRIPPAADAFDISVPLVVSYDEIGATARKLLKDQTFEADTPAGHIQLAIDDVDVYPSDGSLVIGVHLDARTGAQLLDTRGWVYLSAKPVLDADKQIVSLRDVTATGRLDNPVWTTLSVLLDTQLRQLIEENAHYDLRPQIAELTKELTAELAEIGARQKIAVSLKASFAGLRSIELEDKQVAVFVGMSGTAKVSVDALAIPLQ